jgi:cation transport protein ChaC
VNIWIFGYGSLMWDRWEDAHECARRMSATLGGYRRVFNKPSVRNWGTKKFPCPTLNLMRSDSSSCRGMAFEFLENQEEQVLTYLTAREGSGFGLHQLSIRLDQGDDVVATVAIYEGKNLIPPDEVKHVAEMVPRASDKNGPCIHYLKGINEELQRLGIDDPAVRELWAVVAQSH